MYALKHGQLVRTLEPDIAPSRPSDPQTQVQIQIQAQNQVEAQKAGGEELQTTDQIRRTMPSMLVRHRTNP